MARDVPKRRPRFRRLNRGATAMLVAVATSTSAAVAAEATIATPTASAASYVFVHYCNPCGPVPVGSIVLAYEGGWDKNYFQYEGNGVVWGWEKVLKYSGPTVVSDRHPYNNYAFNSSSDLCSYWYGGIDTTPGVGIYADYAHTIYGTARYEQGNAGCP